MTYQEFSTRLNTLLGDRESMELDFSIPEHAKFFLDTHGGEELLKDKYHAVYSCFQRTRQYHSEQALGDKAGQNTDFSTFISPPRYDTKAVKASLDAASPVTITQRLMTTLNRSKIGHYSISGRFQSFSPRQYYASINDSFNEKDLQQNGGVCNTVVSARDSNPWNKNVGVECQCLYYDKDNKTFREILRKTSHDSNNEGADPIKSFTIEHPHVKDGSYRKRINIVYKDRSWSDHDYSYNDVEAVGDTIKTMLPIKGEIKLKNDSKEKKRYTVQEFGERTEAVTLSFHDTHFVTYNNDLKRSIHFTQGGDTISFELETDWNTTFPTKGFGYEIITNLIMPFRLVLKEIDSDPAVADHDIDSVFCVFSQNDWTDPYYVSETFDVVIPEIQYLWGCFGKDTRILMADGTEKLISQIATGEKVTVYPSGAAAVTNVLTGTEKRMVFIETVDNKSILVTGDHPVLTERGGVLASSLQINDKLVNGDGSRVGIRYLYPTEYNSEIYNLELDAPHMIIANGFVAGDTATQNGALQNDAMAVGHEQELYTELDALRKECEFFLDDRP